MSDCLVRAISKDGMVKAVAVSTRELTERARQIHKTLPVATAALGRTLAAASMMGNALKSDGSSLTRHGGWGSWTLNRDGLTYSGTKDGETVELRFSLRKIYRLLFGAGVNFEVYDGTRILFFVPEEMRSAVDWYMASRILHDRS